MARTPHICATSWASSTSTFTKSTSGISCAKLAKTGAIRRQGPHQAAVKSTTTSRSPAADMARAQAARSASCVTPRGRASSISATESASSSSAFPTCSASRSSPRRTSSAPCSPCWRTKPRPRRSASPPDRPSSFCCSAALVRRRRRYLGSLGWDRMLLTTLTAVARASRCPSSRPTALATAVRFEAGCAAAAAAVAVAVAVAESRGATTIPASVPSAKEQSTSSAPSGTSKSNGAAEVESASTPEKVMLRPLLSERLTLAAR
mmetsp:Transcript_22356/g.71523  ORF Transcript_22356/g.71523 Transcript_22356/m.71523 type:complete len:263 (+) Transcript_22356:185-973(+)